MAEKPLTTPLPADLPENWTAGQIVAPTGEEVGLSKQHGYNYLMQMVNRAQSGVNAVNDAFETVSGKRTCRVVVGTSTAGWTAADCDYLCDGVDDQVEIQQAINALPKNTDSVDFFLPGEVVILTGVYHLTGPIRAASDCSILGSSPGTVLVRDTEYGYSNEKNAIISLNAGSCFKNFIIADAKRTDESDTTKNGNVLLSSWGTNVIENVKFIGRRSSVGIYLYQNNGGSVGSFYAGTHIRSCEFSSFDIAILMNGRSGSYSSIESNSCSLSDHVEKFVDVDSSNDSGSYNTPASVSVINNRAINSRFFLKTSYSGSNFIIGNSFFTIEISNEEPSDANFYIGSVIADNVLYRHNVAEPVITLGEYTKGWFVTGNQVLSLAHNSNDSYVPIVDNGTNNIVRFNSNDPGGSTPATVQQAAPTITVDENGTVTARATQAAGYVAAGTRGATHQLSATDDPDLAPENIREGATIFGVSGTYAGSGGGASGVSSFNGRSGDVQPSSGDYTADMVGARASNWTPSASEVGAVPAGAVGSIQLLTEAEYNALTSKNASTLYLIKE